MKYSAWRNVSFSKLSLGTVQLGVDYGINNQDGKPDRASAYGILDTALALGINSLDTAAAYGDSEQVIGDWLKTVDAGKRPFVTTKLSSLDHSSLNSLRKSVREQLERSKARLGLETIPMVMLHHCDEYDCDRKNVEQVFAELKASGDVRFCGISAYAHHDYRAIAASGFDAVQIPLNLFDWRQINNGGIDALRRAGMAVFVRSVYLQGLVFKAPEQLRPEMAFAREPLEKFRALCVKYGMQPAELAIAFAMSLPGITCLVLGSEKAEQVRQNVAVFERVNELTPSQMHEIQSAFAGIDERVVTATAWYNA